MTSILLEFRPNLNPRGKDKKLRDGLSAVTQIGETLWVVNDEATSLERLSLAKEGKSGIYKYGRHHTQFSLNDYLRLPIQPRKSKGVNEVDVEGLDYKGGYLWLVGSHSLIRKKPSLKYGAKKAQDQLQKVIRTGNRYLLARIPVVEGGGTSTLTKKTARDGKARAPARPVAW